MRNDHGAQLAGTAATIDWVGGSDFLDTRPARRSAREARRSHGGAIPDVGSGPMEPSLVGGLDDDHWRVFRDVQRQINGGVFRGDAQRGTVMERALMLVAWGMIIIFVVALVFWTVAHT